MQLQVSRKLFSASLLALAACLNVGVAFASDTDDVVEAIKNYHAAIASLDMAKFNAIWSHDDSILDVEPAGNTKITIGWEGARKNFEALVAFTAELSIEQLEAPHVQVQGDTAWATGVAKVQSKTKAGVTISGAILESDVFRKLDGHWLLVSHVATIMPH